MIPLPVVAAARTAMSLAATWWKAAAGFALGALLVFPLGQCEGAKVERQRTAARQAQAELAIERRNSSIKETSGAERAIDTAGVTARTKEQTDAVNRVPDARPGARTLSRRCVQLRQQHLDTSKLPECAGS